MSYSLVQEGAEIVVSGGTSGSVTLNGVGGGHLLTASALNDSNATATFTASDNNGNTWHSAVQAGDATLSGLAAELYAGGVNAGNTTITVTASASINFRARIREWSSTLGSVWSLAASDSDVTNGTNTHQASASGINPAAACICVVCGCSMFALASPNAGSGYTPETSGSAFDFYEYQIFSSAPTNEKGLWSDTNGGRVVSVIAAYKAAGGGAVTVGAFISGGVGNLIGA